MKRVAVLLVALGVCGLLGCEIDASIGRDGLESQGEGGGDVVAEDGGTNGTSDDGGQGGSGEGGDQGGSGGGEGTTSSSSDTEAGTGNDTTDVPSLCHPADTDTECGTCRKGHCCDELVHCHDEPGCYCYWDCLLGADATPDSCHTHCSYDGSAFDQLTACAVDQCPTVCSAHPEDPPPTD